ncbi:hypothetical protein NsoK4_02340 [Nitrosopumilus sp. K4]|uniref:hypothetical protein n=1 Tax=Nitrosopumilus sp. K4 TaxID=2795383 RepID=UPI001BA4876F|nr:hypothetical protein [Nitrosopumilus sp. K4]QUC65124.1 hypothetical protein NsoK4_02340 [Nitrosopumilus sp. K4]
MAEIDTQKDVYLFLHGKMDMREKAVNALVSKGFSQEKITMALPNKVGNAGDYMAMLWMPPNPDHIKIQQITKVEQVEPEGMIGLWKGVSKEDIDTIPLGID